MLRVYNSKGFLSSVYLNDLPHDSKMKFTPFKMFVFRKSSAIIFDNNMDFQERANIWIKEIESDKRFTALEKAKLIMFISKMKLTEQGL